jgi:hypothetical protein
MRSDDSKIFGALFHSFRDSVLQEFEVVYREKLDSTQTLEEQLRAYLLSDPDCLQLKPIWGATKNQVSSLFFCNKNYTRAIKNIFNFWL